MRMSKMKPVLTTLAGSALVLVLSACELRRDGTAEEPSPTASSDDPALTAGMPGAIPADPEAGETPAVSIIRDPETPVEVAEAVAEPVELTLPFPDGTNISEAAERRLAGLMQEAAIEEEDWPVVLSGHTDSGGNDRANLRASRARAEAVAAWLVERGVDDDRIEVIAFGEQNPIAPNALPDGTANEAGRRTNRRVEIRIAPPDDESDQDQPDTAEPDQDA